MMTLQTVLILVQMLVLFLQMSLAYIRKSKPSPGHFSTALLANCLETSITSLTEAACYEPSHFSFHYLLLVVLVL